MKKFSVLFLIIAWAGSLQAQAPKYFYGMASWYGEEMAGKKTASGQIFDPNALTAAHKTLPFGTLVEVESLENGNKVQVVINDRGPVTGSRVIDVSKKAAEQLGHLESGTFYVRVTIIKEGTGVVTNSSTQQVTTNTVSTDTSTTPLIDEDVVGDEDTNTVDNSTNSGYQDKVIEREVTDKVIDLDMSDNPDLDKEFITDEPEDSDRNPINDLDKPVVVVDDKNVVDLDQIPDNKGTDTSKKVTPTNTTQTVNKTVNTDNSLIVDKTLVTPDILLTNDSVIKVEKDEINKELDIEIETPFEDEDIKKVDTTQKVTNTTKNTQKVVQVNEDWNTKTEPQYDSDAQGYSYAVQVGAFKKEANALKLYDRLLQKKLPVFTTEVFVKGARYIRVRVGYFGSLSQAQSVQKQMQSLNLPGIIIKVKLSEK